MNKSLIVSQIAQALENQNLFIEKLNFKETKENKIAIIIISTKGIKTNEQTRNN